MSDDSIKKSKFVKKYKNENSGLSKNFSKFNNDNKNQILDNKSDLSDNEFKDDLNNEIQHEFKEINVKKCNEINVKTE